MQMSLNSSQPFHHLLASRDSGCVSAHDYHTLTTDSSSRLSQASPVTPHSLPELRSTSKYRLILDILLTIVSKNFNDIAINKNDYRE